MAPRREDQEPEHPQDRGQPQPRVRIPPRLPEPPPGEHERNPRDQVRGDDDGHVPPFSLAADYGPDRGGVVGGWTPAPITPIVRGVWTRRSFPFIFFGLLIVAIVGRSMALFVIWLLVMAGYAASLVVHPRARCLHCGGTGELRGSLIPWSFRRCPKCQGGRIVRRGASAIGLPHVRQQAAQQRQERKETRTRERW